MGSLALTMGNCWKLLLFHFLEASQFKKTLATLRSHMGWDSGSRRFSCPCLPLLWSDKERSLSGLCQLLDPRPYCFQKTYTASSGGHKGQRTCGSLSCFVFPLCVNYYAVLSFFHSEHGSKADCYSFKISGRLWLKEMSPIKEKGEEKGIHWMQNDWRGRIAHTSLLTCSTQLVWSWGKSVWATHNPEYSHWVDVIMRLTVKSSSSSGSGGETPS